MQPADLTGHVDPDSVVGPSPHGPEVTDADAEATRYPIFLNVLGSDLRLDCSQPETAETLLAAWSWSVVASRDVAPDGAIDVPDDAAILGEDGLASVHLRIGLTAGRRLDHSWLLVEAFGIADDDGRVALLVGRGVREHMATLLDLCRADLAYVGSDLVAIGPENAILACPNPVVLPAGPGSERRAKARGPEALGLRRPAASLTLSRIVLMERREDSADASVFEAVSLMDALAALTPRVAVWRSPHEPLQSLARMVDHCGGAHMVDLRPGTDVTGVLRAVLRAPEAGTESWSAVADRAVNPMAWGLRDGKVRQKPAVDAIEASGEVMVLVERGPRRLGPLGATIWRRARAGASIKDLEGAAVAEHGPHPQAEDLVLAGVTELSESGVVARGEPITLAGVLAGRLSL